MARTHSLTLRWFVTTIGAFVAFAALAGTQAQAAATSGSSTKKGSSQQSPLPLDPLTAEDRRLAEEIAGADAKVHGLFAGATYRFVSIELLPLKPDQESKGAPTQPLTLDRHAAMLYRRAGDESGLRVVVNLTKRSIVSSSEVTSAEVPLTPEDINEAAQLALTNKELRSALSSDAEGYAAASKSPGTHTDRFAITGLRLFSSDEKDPCKTHRCVRLMFRRDRDYLGQPMVWVDLTDRQVHVEGRQQ